MGFTERRKSKRVADALALSIESKSASTPPTTGTYVVKLSTNGMRFSSTTELPTDTPVKVALHLTSQAVPVVLQAQVVQCAKNQSTNAAVGAYPTRVIFKDIDDRIRALLERHIDEVTKRTQVIKELPYRRSA